MIMVRGVKQLIIINQITTQMGGVMEYPSMGPMKPPAKPMSQWRGPTPPTETISGETHA
jgi:hypothetical protein